MTAYLDGRPRKVRAGTVILIPPGVRHKFVTGAGACEALSLFSPALKVGPGGDIHTE
jgi:quercetin dioxygenase-like cupin family protein